MPGFEQAVLRVLQSLAPGEVVTYGEVAAEAGRPGAARAVARILATDDHDVPWWRVVTATGRLVPGNEVEHARRLRAEGVEVRGGRVAAAQTWPWPTVRAGRARPWRPRRSPGRAAEPFRASAPPGLGAARPGAGDRPVHHLARGAADSEAMPATASDLAHGSFSDTPPWTLDDPDTLVWRQGLDAVRSRVRAEVPDLTTPGRWPPGARLVTVTARLGAAVGLWAGRDRRVGGTISRRGISRRLRRAAERLGPTYIKLGQIISSGEGIFPAELVDEFKLCRDQVPAEPFRVVREVIEGDLGRPLEEVFRWVDRTPLAAASIAQVHAATLRTGEAVVVKVQRPTVASLVRHDLRVMAWLAPKLVGRIPIAALANPPALVELFAQTIAEELDFRLEAENMLDVARTFAELDQRGYVIPRPHPTLVTPRVLVMERLDGFRFDDVVGMQGAGVDTQAVVRTGMIGFVEGAILHGIFHGDLHGGNLFVLPDGRTALLDFGITGRLDEPRRLAFLRLLMGGSANDVMAQLAALRDLGALPSDADLDAVFRELRLDQRPVDPTTMTGEQLVGELQQVVKSLLGLGARLPKELMLFVKNMVFLDGAIATLAPDLDLFGEITHLSMYFATRHGDRILADAGIDPREVELDLEGVKASFGLEGDTAQLTHRELRERRETIRRNLSGRPRQGPGSRRR